MEKLIELVQNIGNEVCENCGPYSDCEVDPNECERIQRANEMISDFLEERELEDNE